MIESADGQSNLAVTAIVDGGNVVRLVREMRTFFDGILETTERLRTSRSGDSLTGRHHHLSSIITNPAVKMLFTLRSWLLFLAPMSGRDPFDAKPDVQKQVVFNTLRMMSAVLYAVAAIRDIGSQLSEQDREACLAISDRIIFFSMKVT